jgi:hypothetical protein
MNTKSAQFNVLLTFIASFLGALLAVVIMRYFAPSECELLPSLKEMAEVSNSGGDVQIEEEIEIIDEGVPVNEESEAGADVAVNPDNAN